MAAISIGTLTDLEKTSYVKEGLDIAIPKFIYTQYGMSDRVEKREGKTRQWFRMTKPAVTSGSSGNFSGYTYEKNTTGAPPTWTPATPADTTITATVDSLFGQGYQWNEAVEYTSFADIPKELRIINAEHAAEAVETETRDILKVGTNVQYANGKASRGLVTSTDKIDMDDLNDALVTMRNNSTPLIKGMYSVLCSANTIGQLMKDSDFKTAVQMQKDYLFKGTITELFGMRFHWSELAPSVSNSGSNNAVSTVEQTLILGDKSFGKTKWLLNDYDVVYTAPGGHGDEWAVINALTWKFYYKAVILNQSWLLRLEHAR